MVWSDPEIKKLSKHFVTVADEVYMLYPEDPHNLARVANNPDHQFFKKYGEAMPRGAWNHPGTKQGIYMMGPNAEYLEGKFAASDNAGDIRARIERALERWETLRREKNYANQPVPEVPFRLPPGIEGELVFRVNLRDLPRGEGDRSGARFDGVYNHFSEFVRWAWNENWVGVGTAADFVPLGRGVEAVPEATVRHIAREVLVDNVRGQAPTWEAEDVKEAVLTKQRKGDVIEYRGRVRMDDGSRKYEAAIYGQGVWDGKAFRSLDLVAVGPRSGMARFNQRANDLGPAPMGVTLSLHR
ncbi:MAG: hypothetical protein AMXMBFR81_17680 [Chthonomonas sp.]